MVKLPYVLLSFLSLLPLSAQAESSLCTDPVKTICESAPSAVPHHLALTLSLQAANEVNRLYGEHRAVITYAADLKKTLEAEARAGGTDGIGETLRRGFLYLACEDYLSRARFAGLADVITCFGDELRDQSPANFHQVFGELSDRNDFPVLDGAVQQAKAFVQTVILQSRLSTQLKAKLAEKLKNTPTLSILEMMQMGFVKTGPAEAKAVPRMISDLLTNCDPTLQFANAFNYHGSEVPHALVICPSLWLSGMKSLSGGDVSVLFTALAHELGHTVENEIAKDNTEGSPSDQTLACMDKRYVEAKKLSIIYPFAPGTDDAKWFDRELDFKPEAHISELYFDEFSADVISAKAFALYLDLPENRVRAEQLVIDNLKLFCEIKSASPLEAPYFVHNTLHPDGAFRIETGFLSNAELRQNLGCTSPAPEPACSFL